MIKAWSENGHKPMKRFFSNEKLNAVKCLLIRNHSDDTQYKINLTT